MRLLAPDKFLAPQLFLPVRTLKSLENTSNQSKQPPASDPPLNRFPGANSAQLTIQNSRLQGVNQIPNIPPHWVPTSITTIVNFIVSCPYAPTRNITHFRPPLPTYNVRNSHSCSTISSICEEFAPKFCIDFRNLTSLR